MTLETGVEAGGRVLCSDAVSSNLERERQMYNFTNSQLTPEILHARKKRSNRSVYEP
jgi:hypothetical protein